MTLGYPTPQQDLPRLVQGNLKGERIRVNGELVPDVGEKPLYLVGAMRAPCAPMRQHEAVKEWR
ncbi:MAG: hypothetical protein LCH73_10105 [Proteobacteria bacterium]|nr:hypothetical protein [Pseudomonadota bacterium]